MPKVTKKSRGTPGTPGDCDDPDIDMTGEEIDDTPSSDPFAKMQAFMEAQFRNTNDNIRKMNSSMSKMGALIKAKAPSLNWLFYFFRVITKS